MKFEQQINNYLEKSKQFTKDYVENSLKELTGEIEEQVTSLLNNEFKDRHGLADKILDKAEFLQPLLNGIGSVISNLGEKVVNSVAIHCHHQIKFLFPM